MAESSPHPNGAPPRAIGAPLVMGLGGTLGIVNAEGVVRAVTGSRRPANGAPSGDWLTPGADYRQAFTRGPHSRAVTVRIVATLDLLLAGQLEWADDYLGTENHGWVHFQTTRLHLPTGGGAVFAYERLPRLQAPPEPGRDGQGQVAETHAEMFSRLTKVAVDVLRSRCLKSIRGITRSIGQLTNLPAHANDARIAELRNQASRLERDLPAMAQLLDLIEGYSERTCGSVNVPPHLREVT